MFSNEAVERLLSAFQQRMSASNARPRTPEWSPFQIEGERQFYPAHARPKNKKLLMANDDALQSGAAFATTAWMAGGLLSNFASEGLLFLGYPQLAEMAQRPEYRLMAEIRAEEMTRKWTSFRGTDDESTKEEGKPKDQNDDDRARADERKKTGEAPRSDGRNKEIEKKIKELKDYEEELKVRAWFKDVAAQDNFFGISHLFLDFGDSDLEKLRDPELAANIGNGRDKATKQKFGRKMKLKGLRTIEAIWCYPTTYNAINPLTRSWYDPQVWYVMGAEIHKSRLLPFMSRPLPDMLKPAYAFGGLSMSQMAQPYVDIWLKTRMSVGEMIHAYSVMVLMTQLGTTTEAGGMAGMNGDVLGRVALFNQLRDNMGTFVLDKNTEDFKNVSASIAGIDELQAQSQEHMFAVSRIPAVKFAGIQPKGLNATSEGELRAFNDTVHGTQEALFRTHLTTVYDFMQLSLWGARDPDITYDFEPLHEMTDKEKGELRKMDAETDQIRIDSGVVRQEEARTKLAADPESGYDGIDPEDVPDLLDEEEEGLEPEGGRPQPQAEKGEQEEGGGQDAVLPFVGDEAGFEESKHPRKSDGKFASKGAGKEGATEKEFDDSVLEAENMLTAVLGKGGDPKKLPEEMKDALTLTYGSLEDAVYAIEAAAHEQDEPPSKSEPQPQFKTKKDLAGAMLLKGTSKAELMEALGWAQVTPASLVKKLGMKLVQLPGGKFKGVPLTPEEAKAAKEKDAAAKAAKQKKTESEALAAAHKANVEKAAEPKPEPKPAAPTAFPAPTAAEFEKAKKTNALQLQYVPAASGLVTNGSKSEAQKLVEAFNAKYAGKEIAQGPALVQKVNDFKTMNAAVEQLVKGDAAKAAELQKEQAAKAAKAAAEQAEKLKKAKEEHIAKNKAAMDALGITEQEAVGFNALVEMMGGTQADVIESFKKFEMQAKGHGYPISGFQYALIRNYIDGGYAGINKALRSGAWAPQQHVYARLVNNALDKMPKFTGYADRGASLNAEDIAKYKPGHIIQEQSFTSSGIGYSFSGNVRYKIKANGKRGADFSGGANKNEKEVLFKAGTYFQVHKVETKGGTTYIEMEEIEGHG